MAEPDPSECSIKVVCRVRPLNNSEKERGDSCVIHVPSDEQISVSVSFEKQIDLTILTFNSKVQD